MTIRNDNDLIGDFIGTIPAMQALGAEVIIKDSMTELFNMARLKRATEESHDKAFDLHGAFALADRKNLHMIQANYHFVGLDIPADVPRPKLTYHDFYVRRFDYVLAPFSRSLPKEQLWQREKWQCLVNSMPDKSFCLMGSLVHDDPEYITGKNVTPIFGKSWAYVCNVLKQSQLISVVTGLSHLAYALEVKNYLFVNQGSWGKNPEAVYMDKHIPDIYVQDVMAKLQNY